MFRVKGVFIYGVKRVYCLCTCSYVTNASLGKQYRMTGCELMTNSWRHALTCETDSWEASSSVDGNLTDSWRTGALAVHERWWEVWCGERRDTDLQLGLRAHGHARTRPRPANTPPPPTRRVDTAIRRVRMWRYSVTCESSSSTSCTPNTDDNYVIETIRAFRRHRITAL